MAMASTRDRLSFWACLRPRHRMESRQAVEDLPIDIWDLLDDFIEGSPARGRSRDWLTRRSGGLHLHPPPELVDVSAVMRKCHKETYKPGSTRWGKGKTEGDQSECPVCLDTFVSKDQLLSLPCNHRFHINCITPWIERRHACCPCCRADILGGTKKGDKATSSSSIQNGRSLVGIHNARSWGTGLGTIIRRVRVHRGAPNYNNNQASDGRDAWEGLHDYITAALAEMDVELNRLLR